jgi:hypothetical protein
MRTLIQASLVAALGFVLTGASVSGASIYAAKLSGVNAGNASTGTGSAVVTLNGNTLGVLVTFTGLGSPDVAAHIHCCGPLGTDEPVALPFTTFPLGATAGMFTSPSYDLMNAATYQAAFLTANGGTAASAEAALIAGLNGGMTYVNIHTQNFPGGEIRGQLGAVPEPSTMLLAGGALGALALLRRRQRQ